MRIGYACLTIGVPDTGIKSCIMKNAGEAKLLELISHNLHSLENIIDYNIENSIRLFRISSDLIPFGSSAVNKISWWDLFRTEFLRIGRKIEDNNIRVSMHPGQYTVINSPNEEIVKRAIDDLKYHSRVLDSLGVGSEHKIILHIGGVYRDKKLAVSRFVTNYYSLPASIRNRIALENDDKSYNICDVLEIAAIIGAPIVYDNLHNEMNPCDRNKCDVFWINECKKTWKGDDGIQKIHYSQQDPSKRPGSHSESILFDKFMAFYSSLEQDDIDIMLEVKDKNLSALNCISSLSPEDTR